MILKKLHHVAYRCRDAEETVRFYTEVLGLTYAAAVTAEYVPSIKQRCPYMHIFFEMEDGSYIAFFEVPESPPAQRDPNTPEWVQHLALEVESLAVLESAKKMLTEKGIDVVGPTDHGFITSIYFFDPNGHRLEMTVRTDAPGELTRKRQSAESMLQEWKAYKREHQYPTHQESL